MSRQITLKRFLSFVLFFGIVAVSLGARATSADEGQPTPEPEYRIRVQQNSGSVSLAFGTHQAGLEACATVRAMLQDGDPKRSSAEIRILRKEGAAEAIAVSVPDRVCGNARMSPWETTATLVVLQDGQVLKTRVLGSFTKALSAFAELARRSAERVLETGEPERVKILVERSDKSVPEMIRALARRVGVNVSTALRVAACESHFNPRAFNGTCCAGVYQQHLLYWKDRARAFGHPGASVYDAYANIDVSLKMARSMGWSHWSCY